MADLELLHLVARAAAGARPFEHRIACVDLWARLGRTFDLVACVLMPNHVHVLAQVERDVATRAFAQVLSAFRRRMRALRTADIEFEWEPLPRPEKVQNDKRHIARTVRYIHLNPTRDDLCGDPLDWEWSTHRDWVGAVARSCVDRSRWARAMGCRPRSYAEWLHEYVSSDVSVRDASPLPDPRPFLAVEPKDASIDAIGTAVPRVLRSAGIVPAEYTAAERRLFLLSAARWTRYRSPELARHLCRHRSNAWRVMRAAAEGHEHAADVNDAPIPDNGLMFSGHSRPSNDSRQMVSERSRTLSDDELRAMALVLADSRLLSPRLRGPYLERPPLRQHRTR